MKNRKLALISGHNRANYLPPFARRDPGAVLYSNGKEITNEHYEAEKLVYPAYEELIALGYDVILCPFNKTLAQKTRWCNKNLTSRDFIVSVHLNASTNPIANGSELYYLDGHAPSRVRGTRLAAILCRTMGMRNRGRKADTRTRHGRLGIIRDTKANSFLLEMGFLTNEEDLSKARNFGVQAIIDSCKYLLN